MTPIIEPGERSASRTGNGARTINLRLSAAPCSTVRLGLLPSDWPCYETGCAPCSRNASMNRLLRRRAWPIANRPFFDGVTVKSPDSPTVTLTPSPMKILGC